MLYLISIIRLFYKLTNPAHKAMIKNKDNLEKVPADVKTLIRARSPEGTYGLLLT